MDDTVKLTSISVVFGFIAGVLSWIFSFGLLNFTNDFVGLIIGIVLIYALIKSADKIAVEKMENSQKIWDCVMPFFFSWVIVWILINNYL